MINLIYFLTTIIYFSLVITYTYDVQENCDCDVKWYFDFIKYFSIIYILLSVLVVGYVFMLYLSYTANMVWKNTIMKYIILMLILLKAIGLVVYFYIFFQFQKTINQNKNQCKCYGNKFYDIINICTYIYIGIVILGLILTIARLLIHSK